MRRAGMSGWRTQNARVYLPIAISMMLIWLSEGERIFGGLSVRGAAERQTEREQLKSNVFFSLPQPPVDSGSMINSLKTTIKKKGCIRNGEQNAMGIWYLKSGWRRERMNGCDSRNEPFKAFKREVAPAAGLMLFIRGKNERVERMRQGRGLWHRSCTVLTADVWLVSRFRLYSIARGKNNM